MHGFVLFAGVCRVQAGVLRLPQPRPIKICYVCFAGVFRENSPSDVLVMVESLPWASLFYMGLATTAFTLWVEMNALKEVGFFSFFSFFGIHSIVEDTLGFKSILQMKLLRIRWGLPHMLAGLFGIAWNACRGCSCREPVSMACSWT